MSVTPRPPIPSFIPESAPFTPEQRLWLNGLFAGVFGLEGSVTPLSPADSAQLLSGLLGGVAAPAPVAAVAQRHFDFGVEAQRRGRLAGRARRRGQQLSIRA